MKPENTLTILFALLALGLFALAALNSASGCDMEHRGNCYLVQHFWEGK